FAVLVRRRMLLIASQPRCQKRKRTDTHRQTRIPRKNPQRLTNLFLGGTFLTFLEGSFALIFLTTGRCSVTIMSYVVFYEDKACRHGLAYIISGGCSLPKYALTFAFLQYKHWISVNWTVTENQSSAIMRHVANKIASLTQHMNHEIPIG